jgi:hypothetical protein
MSEVIEVFRSDEYVPDGEIPLAPVLHDVFGEIIGPNSAGVSFDLVFQPLPDVSTVPGEPSLVNLRASHGVVQVRISRDGKLLYQREHPVRELVAARLRELLRARDPAVDHWGYRVTITGQQAVARRRPTPRGQHEVLMAPRTRRRTAFTVEEMPEPPLPTASLAALGADAEPVRTGPQPVVRRMGGAGLGNKADPTATRTPPVGIVVPVAIVDQLLRTVPFSAELEEGGFLTGNVFSDTNRPGGYLVKVTAVIPAERTGASMSTFTFSGDSFVRINERIESANNRVPRGQPPEMLLGWYHTHLVSTESLPGLSDPDVVLHTSTFLRPWQLAALINIEADGRVLRFYHAEHDPVAKVPHWQARS